MLLFPLKKAEIGSRERRPGNYGANDRTTSERRMWNLIEMP